MKRVVLIRSNPVSPDPPVEKMANTLLKYGYEVIIIGWDRYESYYKKETDILLSNGVAKVVRFGIVAPFGGGIRKSWRQFLQFQLRLRKWLLKNRNYYDVIHAFDYDTGYTAYRCTKKLKKAFIYHILDYYVASHGLARTRIGGCIKNSEDRLIDNSDVTVICTEKRVEQIIDANPKKLFVIHNTPDIEFARVEVSKFSCSDRCRIVYVGVLDEGRFLKEIISFVELHSEYELHIGGFGPMESFIKSKAEDNKRITFYGKIPYEKTLSLELGCDIMFAIYDPNIPNHKYSAPNKFYEALMLGKPIIMARNTGFDEVIEENDIGIVIDYSIEGLNEGLERVLKRKNEWNSMADRGKKLYKDKYSWKKMEENIVKMYEQIN